jgi:hypothetical protein
MILAFRKLKEGHNDWLTASLGYIVKGCLK